MPPPQLPWWGGNQRQTAGSACPFIQHHLRRSSNHLLVEHTNIDIDTFYCCFVLFCFVWLPSKRILFLFPTIPCKGLKYYHTWLHLITSIWPKARFMCKKVNKMNASVVCWNVNIVPFFLSRCGNDICNHLTELPLCFDDLFLLNLFPKQNVIMQKTEDYSDSKWSNLCTATLRWSKVEKINGAE